MVEKHGDDGESQGWLFPGNVMVEKHGDDGESPKIDRSSSAPSSKTFSDELS
jgi:hypothetical protein